MHPNAQADALPPLLAARAARSSALLAAPGFAHAVAGYCREMAAVDLPGRPAAKLFNQFGRYMVSFLLIHQYQHWQCHGGPPATLRRLQETSPLSARQTAAIVAGLRAGRLLTGEPLAGSRGQMLAPAAPLTGTITRSMIAFLRAVDALDRHEPPRAAAFEHDVALQNELVYRSAEFVLDQGSHLDAFPSVRHFTDRDCGYLVLVAVMAVALSRSDAGGPLSCRHLARHFSISRSHVGNLLAMAAGNGWFATDGRGRLRHVASDFTYEFQRWAAAEMAHYAALVDAILPRDPRAAAPHMAA